METHATTWKQLIAKVEQVTEGNPKVKASEIIARLEAIRQQQGDIGREVHELLNVQHDLRITFDGKQLTLSKKVD